MRGSREPAHRFQFVLSQLKGLLLLVDKFAELGLKLIGLMDAVAAPSGFAVDEEDKRRHGTYMVSGRQLGVAVYVDLYDVDRIAQ